MPYSNISYNLLEYSELTVVRHSSRRPHPRNGFNKAQYMPQHKPSRLGRYFSPHRRPAAAVGRSPFLGERVSRPLRAAKIAALPGKSGRVNAYKTDAHEFL